jgi:hypothetical protein
MLDTRARRLRQALELFEVAEALLDQRLIREGVPADQRALRIRAWRRDRPFAPHGDAWGRPVDVGRFR